MYIKERIIGILAETKKLISLTDKGREAVESFHKEAALKFLDEIIKIDIKELKELNEIFKDLDFEDGDIVRILQELTSECHQVIETARKLIGDIQEDKFMNEDHKNEIISLLEKIREIGVKQRELEGMFYSMKATEFEEILEEENVGKLPRKPTLSRIQRIKSMYLEYNRWSDLQKAIKFQELVLSIGPGKANKYFKRVFFFLRQGDKMAKRLWKVNPKNELLNSGEELEFSKSEEKSNIPEKIKIPFPRDGFPRSSDLAFLLTHGMLFSVFSASLMGGIWTAAFTFLGAASGLVSLSVVMAITFFFVRKRAFRYPQLAKKAANLIVFISQGGDLSLIYDARKILPEPGTVRV
ncbi:hypothetical protein CMO83_02200 [Candidatus Woesearchaeota archaeon]|mgnify:CR=1 FL=1|jgi:DNA-binding MarR family transcriptional regulator|nr:hypothetical protein [Candidatus Woesearchaeota archaeon]|tara:strand:- start:41 stop:1099 length:1059 start_codon:yes stop_codon:yes gene_type:complete